MTSPKVALVTAAGSGLGAACAKELAARGWKVAVQSASGKGEKLGVELGGIGFTGSSLEAAVLERMVKGTLDKWGRIDAVVNSCPHPPKGKLMEFSDADWHKGVDVILLPVIRMANLVAPVMEKQGGGAIANVSTFAALEPDAAFPMSCVYRAGLAAYCKLFADQFAAKGIRMNNALPGFFDSLPEKEERRKSIPMQRYGRVAEFAKAVAFLVSEDSSYVTGQSLRIDGGVTRMV